MPATLILMLLAGCQSGTGDGGSGDGPVSGGCGCTLGATHCSGGQIQVCEQTAADCTSWGPAVMCPGDSCNNDRCNVNCQDTCAGGAVRCASEGTQQVCRIGGSGCLEWVAQDCDASNYCSNGLCVPRVPCAVGCPAGYTCSPEGVCTGGTPTGLDFDVKTVHVSGKVTLNGADPMATAANCSATQNSTRYKARVTFTEVKFGYVFYADSLCSSTDFTFAQDIYPGVYKVTVGGGYYSKPYLSNLPDTPFAANTALKVSTDTAGLVFDLKTVHVGGQLTLNGAAPQTTTANCSTTQNATRYKARVTFTEINQGYTFYGDSLCQDDGYAFAQEIYPGTYKVTVGGGYYSKPYLSNLPDTPFVVNPSLAVTADNTGLAFDVKTVHVGGQLTLNGVAPQTTTGNCSATQNATRYKARVSFTETTHGYLFYADSLCQDDPYTFAQEIYPGTYKVTVGGGYYSKPYLSNLPDTAFVVNPSLTITADNTGLAYDVKTVHVGGQVTLNGMPPQTTTANCSTTQNATRYKARVTFIETTQGYTFYGDSLCGEDGYTFAQEIYPGTYKVTVGGGYYSRPYLSNLPDTPFVANPALKLVADTMGLAFDLKTVNIGGQVTLNGAPPQTTTANCSTTQNATRYKARVTFTETTQGYTFYGDSLCQDDGYTFAQEIYPGTYKVTVAGGYYARPYLTNLPDAPFVANPALKLAVDTMGLAFDLKTLQVGGQVTLNGATPQTTTGNCSATQNSTRYKTRVSFTETSLGYTFYADSLCQDAPYTFTQEIYPGIYKVTVTGGYYSKPYLTNLPDTPQITVSALQLP